MHETARANNLSQALLWNTKKGIVDHSLFVANVACQTETFVHHMVILLECVWHCALTCQVLIKERMLGNRCALPQMSASMFVLAVMSVASLAILGAEGWGPLCRARINIRKFTKP